MIDRASLAALDATATDHESAASVWGELSAFLGEPLSETTLFSILRSLESQGLVEAYRTSSDNRTFVPAPSSADDPPSAVWFIATVEGHRLLMREWEATFGSTSAEQ